MSTRILRPLVCMLCAVVVFVSACHRKPKAIGPAPVDAGKAKAGAMKKYDTNGDGKIDGEELDKAPSLKWAVETGKRMDVNGDGAVTEDEIGDRIESWLGAKAGLISVDPLVTLDGQPLVGATVKFVPEEFLGTEIKTGTAVTDKSGSAYVTSPNDEGLEGVSPGLYLVEITKEGEDIPERYNTKTIFGIEVGFDVEGLGGDLVFPMKSSEEAD